MIKKKFKFAVQSFFSYLLTAFFFFSFGLFIYHSCCVQDIKIDVYTPDTLLIRKIRNYGSIIDSLKGELLIKPKRFDIVRIDTQYYEVPIIPYVFNDSVCFIIENKKEFIPFKLMIDGYVSEYTIWQKQRIYEIPIQERKNLFDKWYVKGGFIALGIVTFYVLVLK